MEFFIIHDRRKINSEIPLTPLCHPKGARTHYSPAYTGISARTCKQVFEAKWGANPAWIRERSSLLQREARRDLKIS